MTECPRESEVFEAVAFNRLDVVRDHLATCAICAEIADVAGALRADHAVACDAASVPSAGAVWWRATIRARAEAARTVSQPITILQGVAGACGVGLAAALVSLVWRSFSWFARFDDIVIRLDERRDDVAAASALVLQHGLPIMLALAACVVIAPFALYVAFSDD
jgi:hypothetical protein